jgi:hypothetical protein
MAQYLGLSNGTVQYVGAGGDMTGTLWMSDVIIYASFRDEQTFPAIITRAMSLQRPVIAPNRTAFRQHVSESLPFWWSCSVCGFMVDSLWFRVNPKPFLTTGFDLFFPINCFY